MSAQFSSAAIAILAIVTYQMGMKLVPHNINPVSALLTFYVTAIVFTLIAARFSLSQGPVFESSQFSWSAVLVGIAIVGIELGYLLMYRSGWKLAVAPVVGMGAAALILVPVGLLMFRQPWSFRYFFGIAFCIGGLYLLIPQESR